MKKILTYVVVLVICLSLLLSFSLAGCKTTDSSTATAAATTAAAETAAAAKELTKMVWISPEGELENTEDYILWVASAMGYMEQFGIELVMEPGPADSLATTKFVSEKKADVGYPSPAVLISSVAAGMDIIMAWDVVGTQVFDFAVAKDNDKINTVMDIAGKSISVWDPGAQVIVDPILVELGIDPKSVSYVSNGALWGQAVSEGKADVALIWEGMRTQWDSEGMKLKYFLGKDFSKSPGNGYAIRRSDLDDPVRLELDTNFFKACSMAAEFSRLNPRAAGQIVTTQFPGLLTTMNPDLILGSMGELAGLVHFAELNFGGYGGFERANWDNLLKIAFDLGQTDKLYKFDDVATDSLIKEANNYDKAKVAEDAKAFVLNDTWSKIADPGTWD